LPFSIVKCVAWKNHDGKWLKPSSGAAFRRVSQVEKRPFSFLTSGSVSIVIFNDFLRGKSRWKMAETQSWRGFDGFIFMWKKHLFLS